MQKPTLPKVLVKVKTDYQAESSNPEMDFYVFGYAIQIVNHGGEVIQLKKRHWYIYDSRGRRYEVEGDGVVGEQPVLQPGESYRYTSGCHFQSSMGRMKGYYTFERLADASTFKVRIPQFVMQFPPNLN